MHDGSHSNRGDNEESGNIEQRKNVLSPEEIYDRFSHEMTILMGWFMTGHLTRLYKLFDSDFAQLIVLGEIAHHNISPFFAGDKLSDRVGPSDWNLAFSQDALLPCNSFSVSEATGIPRETCRRKVKDLVNRGFLERHPKGGYVITPNVKEHYRDFDRQTFVRWMSVTRAMEKLIDVAESE